MYCVTDVNLQIHRMRNFAKVIAPHILNLWCDEFFQNLVFYILNRVVLIKSCSASSISPIIFESGNAARSTEGGRSGTAEARKPGFRSTEVLVQHRLAAYCTYVHVPRTVRPAIFFGVCKTVRSVVLRRGTKSVFAGAFCSVSRVRTEVHAH